MLLNELFDRPGNWKYLGYNRWIFTVNIKTGEITTDYIEGDADLITYVVDATPIHKDATVPDPDATPGFDTRNPTHKNYYEEFPFLPKENLWEIHFTALTGTGAKADITGTGHSVKVFSTILDILKEFLIRPEAEHIIISATEPSRIKLYGRMFDRISKKKWSHKKLTYWLI